MAEPGDAIKSSAVATHRAAYADPLAVPEAVGADAARADTVAIAGATITRPAPYDGALVNDCALRLPRRSSGQRRTAPTDGAA